MPYQAGRPSALICHTIKGKGMRSTEHNPEWHHKAKLKLEELERLDAELEGAA